MEQKNFDIHMIEALTEAEAAAMALETLTIKDHTVYLVDFGGYFGYSALVYKNAHHIYHANDYELHHAGKTRDALRNWYLHTLENKLFTEAEIAEPITTYDECRRKEAYLHNYYGMQRDYISMFCITHNDAEQEAYKKSVEGKIQNMVAFAYYNPEDAEFVKHHIALYEQLQAAKQNIADDYAYWKSAFYYEMGNHEITSTVRATGMCSLHLATCLGWAILPVWTLISTSFPSARNAAAPTATRENSSCATLWKMTGIKKVFLPVSKSGFFSEDISGGD